MKTARKTKATPQTELVDVFAGVRITHPDRVLVPDAKLTKRDLAVYYTAVASQLVASSRGAPAVSCAARADPPALLLPETPRRIDARCRAQNLDQGENQHSYLHSDRRRRRTDFSGANGCAGDSSLGKSRGSARSARSPHLRPRSGGGRFVGRRGPGRSAYQRPAGRSRTRELCTNDRRQGPTYRRASCRRVAWSQLKAFARAFADAIVREQPKQYIAQSSKLKRPGKIYLDYLRNERRRDGGRRIFDAGAAGAPVATPLAWSELSPSLRSARFNTRTVPERLADMNEDPWQGFFDVKQAVTGAMLAEVERS